MARKLLSSFMLFSMVAHAQEKSGHEVDEFREELAKADALQIPFVDFPSWRSAPKTNLCSFKGLCEYLEKNAGSAVLYRGKDGLIPNFAMAQIESQVANCVDLAKAGPAEDRMKAELEQFKRNMAERPKRVLESFRKLHESMKKNSEEATFAALHEAALSDSVDNPTGTFISGETSIQQRERLGKELAKWEKRSGKFFSAETRKLYLDYLGTMEPDTVDKSGKGESWKRVFSNPFLHQPAFVKTEEAGDKERLRANQAEFQRRSLVARDVFRTVQGRMIAMIEARRTPENTAEIDKMIERVRTIRFMAPRAELPNAFGQSGCPGPNAFYNPEVHAFFLCPQVLQLPVPALTEIVAHELGHSVDPCLITGDFHRIVKSKGEAEGNPLLEPPSFEAKLGMDQPDHHLVDLYSAGVDKIPSEVKQTSIAKIPGIPLARNPFGKVVACLAGKSSIGARMGGGEKTLVSVDLAVQKLRSSGSTEANSRELRDLLSSRKNVERLMKEKAACSFGPNQSQMQESFSDWMAAEIVAAEIAKYPESERAQRTFESMSFGLAMDCQLKNSEVFRKARAAMERIKACDARKEGFIEDLERVARVEARNQDAHPWEVDRVERIHMAQPSLRKAMGCNVSKGVVHCE